MAKDSGKLKSSHILITGNDEFAIKEAGSKALAEIHPGDDMNVETVDAYADKVDDASVRVGRLLEALLTIPFMGGRKVVWFKNCNFLADNPMGRNEAVTSKLARSLEILQTTDPESVQLLITAVGVDKRKAFYKGFNKLDTGLVDLHEQLELKGAAAENRWIDEVDETMRSKGLIPDPGVAEQMVQRVGADKRALFGELEKLELFLHPEKRVSEDDVRAVVSGNRSVLVWDLCDAVTLRRTTEAVRLVRQLLFQGESDVGIIILLTGHLRLAAVGAHLLESGQLDIRRSGRSTTLNFRDGAEDLLPRSAKGDKPNTFRLGRVVEQAKDRPAKKWFRCLEVLYKTHYELVSSGTDRSKALEAALMRICQM